MSIPQVIDELSLIGEQRELLAAANEHYERYGVDQDALASLDQSAGDGLR